MAYDFLLSSETLNTGRKVHYAQLAGSNQPKFVIGYPTLYLGNKGLFNTTLEAAFAYKPQDYITEHDFWAYFIQPTAQAESRGSYFCLNTYDRAKFTFTFMQFAAHVPNGDFINFFKKLLALPIAKEYFPKLILQNNRIFYRYDNGTLKQLEDDKSTVEFMDYLNPSLNEIENQELICCARMVHWVKNDPLHKQIQVNSAIELYKKNMIVYDRRFNLDNTPAKVCQVICDIRHQGRGTNDRIAAAINTNGDYDKAYQNLLLIGDTNYSERIKTVKNTIDKLFTQGIFNKKYSRANNSFID
ncbi:MAG: hypothetical protein Q8M15_16840 [Bacteroidota bacterium]|nr:hypothetical protein [Bacteroidota bacterium]